MKRHNISSGAPWEAVVGYSRAVRIGQLVEVAGTTAVEDGMVLFPDDAYRQTRNILARIEAALAEAGASLKDVVRTRIYVTDISRWGEIGRAHGEVFGDIRPASTMIEVQALVNPEMLVEIEASAWIAE